jgi:DNA (cytosine-5)-methyltransferase 1
MGHWKGFDHHPDLLSRTRDMFNGEREFADRESLTDRGIVWVIENVEGAPMIDAIILCGSMFNLKTERGYLQRHRKFESNLFDISGVPLMVPGPCDHNIAPRAIGVYGNGRGGSGLRERTANAAEARELMGIDWASRNGVTQAIPPAYTEYLGKQVMGVIN